MNRPQYDKNFAVQQTDVPLTFHPVTEPPLELSGYPWWRSNGTFDRLPRKVLEQTRKELAWVAGHGSGGVVRFRSDSPTLAVQLQLTRTEGLPYFSLLAQSGVDAYLGAAPARYFGSFCPQQNLPTYTATLKAPQDAGLTNWTLYLPIINGIQQMHLGVEPDSRLLPPTPRRYEKPIVFYGSSITEGCIASRPGNTYPAMLTRLLDANLVNVGFGGQARGDLAVAQAIAELDMSAFVMDYDHNAPTPEHLQETHAPFFQAIRRAHPTLPIILVSSPNARHAPEFWTRRRDIIRATCQQARSAGDANVYFVDGGSFFPDDTWDSCMCGDRTHPNDLGFHYMAHGLLPVLRQALS